MHLGSLSPAPVQAEEITFDWFGERVRSAPAISDLVLVDFMDRFGSIDIDDPQSLGDAMSGAKTVARDIVHPDDFERFWLASKRNGAGVRDIMALVRALIEEVTGRPTMQPSDLSAGLSDEPTNSVGTPGWISASGLSTRPDLLVAVEAAQRTA